MYPLKMIPEYKNYFWGGQSLKRNYNKTTNISPLAESWEISCHRDGRSLIANGEYAGMPLEKYLEKHPQAIGTKGLGLDRFSILFKLIDANESLSLQVHPSDEYAMRVENDSGKTEMWIVLDCQKGAKLAYGFKTAITKEQFREKINDNTILDVVNFLPVKKGDVFLVMAGTLHSIGKGMVVAEIQQSSNTTYRVYDYGRKGLNGKPRRLDMDKALDVLNLAAAVPTVAPNSVSRREGCEITKLTDCQYFHVENLALSGTCRFVLGEESFAGLFCAEADRFVSLDSMHGAITLKKGDTVFLPAGFGEYILRGNAELISMGI
jgi:mannose-6-phosphate isomerase